MAMELCADLAERGHVLMNHWQVAASRLLQRLQQLSCRLPLPLLCDSVCCRCISNNNSSKSGWLSRGVGIGDVVMEILSFFS